jgi:hypothetical protein
LELQLEMPGVFLLDLLAHFRQRGWVGLISESGLAPSGVGTFRHRQRCRRPDRGEHDGIASAEH